MERKLSAIELMMDGYSKLQKEEGEEVEAIKKDNVEDREMTSIEKMIAGYGNDGIQKEEVKVDPNNIKEEEK
ncbi:hypothetical protein [Cytobacillus firmus]|uniref:hypothetical protein n=1 Tax=Cytobacillus firmus TaxID=1399 RepID=UPI0018CE1CA7|nr:hypothetical protein [Cytobacillus firmus]MBG9589824.1 hypothetical protein [Cytobacillus firmus]